MTVHEDYRDWRVIQGLQMEGTAEQMGRAGDGGRLVELYVAKYPFLRRPTAALAARVYRFTAARILFIDNTKGFGHRQPAEIAGSQTHG